MSGPLFGITIPQLVYLTKLAKRPQRSRAVDQNTVRALVRKGWASRSQLGRGLAVYIELTDAGRAAISRVNEATRPTTARRQ